MRKILNSRDVAKLHVEYQIGRDSSFLLWHDLWAGSPLINTFGTQAVSSLESTNLAKVRTIIRDGEWFTGPSNDFIAQELRRICSNIEIYRHDTLFWDGNTGYSVTISTIWDGIRPTGALPAWYGFVWCKYSVPRFAFTTWLIVQERLLTKDKLTYYRRDVDRSCVMCGIAEETHSHLFCNCSFIRRILSNWDLPISDSWDEIHMGNICSRTLQDPLSLK